MQSGVFIILCPSHLHVLIYVYVCFVCLVETSGTCYCKPTLLLYCEFNSLKVSTPLNKVDTGTLGIKKKELFVFAHLFHFDPFVSCFLLEFIKS